MIMHQTEEQLYAYSRVGHNTRRFIYFTEVRPYSYRDLGFTQENLFL